MPNDVIKSDSESNYREPFDFSFGLWKAPTCEIPNFGRENVKLTANTVVNKWTFKVLPCIGRGYCMSTPNLSAANVNYQ